MSELLGADPEEVLLIAAQDQHRADPDDREEEEGGPEGRERGLLTLGPEAREVASKADRRGADDVADDDPAHVVAPPGTTGLGALAFEARGVRGPATRSWPLVGTQHSITHVKR